MKDTYYTRPLSRSELATFRDDRAIIPDARDRGNPVDWGSSAEHPQSLMSVYGRAGDIPSDRTSSRRRALAA